MSIVGHKRQQALLERDLETNNVAHAYLFTGPRHIGKFTVAKFFSKMLLGRDAESAKERASAETQAEKLLHPDLLVLDRLWVEDACEDFDVIAKFSNIPQQHRSKAKAKTDTIGIDDIRALQERLFEVRTGTHRCCLIRDAARMQEGAVNALLKILEEPPPGMVFIFTAESETAVLPTLLSRMRVVPFSRASRAEIEPMLKQLPPEDAGFLLRLGQGAPGLIHRLLESPDELRLQRQTYAMAMAFWYARTLLEKHRLLQPLHDRSAQADQFLLHLLLALREFRPRVDVRATRALHALIRGLKTNVSRQLLTQQFVMKTARTGG